MEFASQYGLKVEEAIGDWQLPHTLMNEAYDYTNLQGDDDAAFVELNFTWKSSIGNKEQKAPQADAQPEALIA